MRKLHYFVLLGCISLCVLLFSAFWWNESNKSNTSPSRQPYQIQVILKAYHQPPTFWRVVSQGIDAAETEFGVNCEINAPDSESDLERQIELVREAIAKKPDAIILAACDYEKMTPVCKEATDAGILLVTLDSDVNFDGRRAFVGTDNYEMGKKLAGLRKKKPAVKMLSALFHTLKEPLPPHSGWTDCWTTHRMPPPAWLPFLIATDSRYMPSSLPSVCCRNILKSNAWSG